MTGVGAIELLRLALAFSLDLVELTFSTSFLALAFMTGVGAIELLRLALAFSLDLVLADFFNTGALSFLEAGFFLVALACDFFPLVEEAFLALLSLSFCLAASFFKFS